MMSIYLIFYFVDGVKDPADPRSPILFLEENVKDMVCKYFTLAFVIMLKYTDKIWSQIRHLMFEITGVVECFLDEFVVLFHALASL